MTTQIFKSWIELPFREIWSIDFEYYPGRGLANGGKEGDAPVPLCLVAIEMRSGQVIRLWQDELGRFPPYPLDSGALIVSHMFTAEAGCHIARGWGQPASALDTYIEFRHYTNDGAAESSDRGKGFYSLAGALRYFLDDTVDTAHKEEMRDRILQGPPFTAAERAAILEYCEDDVRNLARLLAHLAPTIRSLPHAMARANFAWTLAQQERRGVPIDPFIHQLRERWDAMQTELVTELDTFGIYEIVDGKPHWRRARFIDVVRENQWTWLTLPSGALDESDQAFRDMEGKYPQIGTLRELRYSLSKLKLNDLAVGNDGRNRALLGPYGTKTARNAPSNSKFVFGPAKWIRFLISPPPGRVLIHRDYKQQEPQIAAVLSGDGPLLEAGLSGDVYLGMADQLGFLREGMAPAEVKAVRALFKTVVLGIQYGLGPHSLAARTGISLFEAAEILERLKARFYIFEAFAHRVADHAGLKLEISTPYGWVMQCPPGINPRTVRNFPVQSTASEIMHVACVLAERRGIEIIAPIHDAFLVEADAAHAVEASAALDRVMRDASQVVLRGYEIGTDEQIIHAGNRYYDERGEVMWNTVTKLMKKLEKKSA
jgi:DNA polymerase-1